jgi:hypothetical protein
MNQQELENKEVKQYSFLEEMYQDPYFPSFLIDKGKRILLELCFQIEQEKPQDLAEFYALTHAATERFNDLAVDFDENDSEIETVARELIAQDFEFIAHAYGFEADVEELIATRDW